eukprot:TRINITY_DN1733_c0_g1_i2.p1 TRINITY_DN1733_c0_g1~~TRINITY_DN1733_c0_g1_i2.p1  ORF type:complete len:398 (-),score=138.69 TRINITY_DN1733_c0_g1_i2:200-1393(-)
MSATTPYIGSKLSLISNADIRYEGILYTINTAESTIALKSVRCCGTEGRAKPEIPASSEIYDFIIFRGQDIKDLTVLESATPAMSAQLNDPAIMSVNQRPQGRDTGAGKGAASGGYGGYGSSSGGSYGYGGYGGGGGGGYGGGGGGGGYGGGWGSTGKGGGGYGGYGGGYGGGGKGGGYGGKDSGARGYGGGYDSWGGGWDSWQTGYKGDSGRGKADRDSRGSKGGKADKGGGKTEKGGKGKSDRGGGKDSGKSSGKGGGGKSESAGKGGEGSRRKEGADGAAPVGELLPSVNESTKKEVAEDFDYSQANTKFDKVNKEAEAGIDDKLKPLSGYDKGKSFFDNISCEATECAGDAERPKMDRSKAKQSDRETFGDTRRPPRPAGGRRGGKGGSRRAN